MVSHVILFQLIQKYRIGFPMTIAHAGGENVFSPLIARLPLTFNRYVADVSRNPCALNLFRCYSGFVPSVDPKVWDRLLHDHGGGENVFRLFSPLAGGRQAVYASC